MLCPTAEEATAAPDHSIRHILLPCWAPIKRVVGMYGVVGACRDTASRGWMARGRGGRQHPSVGIHWCTHHVQGTDVATAWKGTGSCTQGRAATVQRSELLRTLRTSAQGKVGLQLGKRWCLRWVMDKWPVFIQYEANYWQWLRFKFTHHNVTNRPFKSHWIKKEPFWKTEGVSLVGYPTAHSWSNYFPWWKNFSHFELKGMTRKLNHCNLFRNPGAHSKLVLSPSPSAVPAFRSTALVGLLQYGVTHVLAATVRLPLLTGFEIQMKFLQAV